ncbi:MULTISPECIES: ABC transporter ATP-binding protein [unclassified Halanaerobium]|uniref:ABC transporter ATP-binding protein n=1 Tax=unclassified Halanaerobium TaxID=2641197 RepID=UPI000E16ABDB|nr:MULTISPECIES: ABC transporter ATP-binding protein [unclassified Halanaerobium]RCW50670.1 nucleoside ABC transporter ATP-binding protein [Halanaerobium sp. MA284_MarDTE_T2]RCW86838.1 nucleoside ABC transporter ATP-binding protein [Halanaerobium sp. DL-01]
MADPIISIKSLLKIYPPSTVAVDGVDLVINSGQIHAVIGENGAGKSTLMKVIYGLTAKTDGEIYINNKKTHFSNPQEAVNAGIGMVHQEFMLIPNYTVYENVILGTEPVGRFNILKKEQSRKKVRQLIEEYNLNLQLDSIINNISVAAQQKVEILKLLYRDVNVLILDEPTAVLTPQEIEDLFMRLKKLRDEGRTIIFISHKLDEVLDLSDIITVMRKGKKITTLENKNLSKADLARAMIGRDVVFTVKKDKASPKDVVFSVSNLKYKNEQGIKLLDNISLEVRAGEIVGVAGIEGNGQYELVRSIIGLLTPDSGEIKINDKRIDKLNILDRRKEMAYVPQDRKNTGSAQELSLVDNSIMTHHRINKNLSGARDYILSRRGARDLTDKLINKFEVISESKSQPIKSLSGGNQQRLIVGREFMLSDNFILLDNPTRGLDVGSIEFIQLEIIKKRDQGAAVLLISADLDELFGLSDRLLVIHEGKIIADKDPTKTNKEEIGAYMLGAEAGDYR